MYFWNCEGSLLCLRHSVRTKSIEICDDICKTCCALHNMLLITYSGHKNWESSACSNWESINAKSEKWNERKFEMNRLNNPRVGCREEDIVQSDDYNLDECEVINTWISRMMPIEIFQSKLIEYFDMWFKRSTIQWLIRCKNKSTI